MNYPWVVEATKYIGLKEIPGKNHNQTIVKWLDYLKAWWRDDETPWCGVAIGYCFKVNNLAIPKYYMRARAWSEDWGIKLKNPINGCVVVFTRNVGGHVGIVTGETKDGFLLVMGGNQNNSFNIMKFSKERVIGYYWPKDYPLPKEENILILDSNANLSTNEA